MLLLTRLGDSITYTFCCLFARLRTYQGVEKQEDNVRGRLFQIQKREREAAREREEKERDELAKLSGSRKK